jgi:hypothetical protein
VIAFPNPEVFEQLRAPFLVVLSSSTALQAETPPFAILGGLESSTSSRGIETGEDVVKMLRAIEAYLQTPR